MLGAAAALLPEISAETLRKTLEKFLVKLGPTEAARNLEAFDQGRSGLKISRRRWGLRKKSLRPRLPRLGWANAPIGGVIVNGGNTALRDMSASRQGVMPKFLPDVCFHCGRCDMVCPDYCFVWKPDEQGTAKLQGIDYTYCKGCSKCVQACPVEALIAVEEKQVPPEERAIHHWPNFSQTSEEIER
jgi:pyruvate ferredoxin oxidoreductase gamma subunit